MTKSDNVRTRIGATSAFFTFCNNYDDLGAFCVLTLSPMLNVWSNITPENLSKLSRADRQTILSMANVAQTGKNIATNLAIVYLVTIMETYIKDAIHELLNQHIRQINRHLLGDPVPMDEDEALFIDVLLEVETDETRSSHLVSKVLHEGVESLLYRTPVRRGLKLLKEHFDIKVEGESSHQKNWEAIKQRRNDIVHRRLKAQSDNESVIEPEYSIEALAQVFDFAQSIELGIVAFRHPEKSSSETLA
jgi:hypothetical protein